MASGGFFFGGEMTTNEFRGGAGEEIVAGSPKTLIPGAWTWDVERDKLITARPLN